MPANERTKLRLMAQMLLGNVNYHQDGLITLHNSEFMDDPKFARSYSRAVRLGLYVDPFMHWRAHTVCWAAAHAKRIGGDFVECGVFKGFLSRIVVDYIDFAHVPHNFYLMDTYEGFADEAITEAERAGGLTAGRYESSYDIVRYVFAHLKNVKIIKGAIPGTLKQVKSRRIAYLHIDMNCTIPEIAAAEYFWGRLARGAIMILDDYGFKGHEEQKKAFDRFARRKKVQILSLPTGQGMIIKP
jgi:hypothetical protein